MGKGPLKKDRFLGTYLLITFGFAWLLWMPAVLRLKGPPLSSLSFFVERYPEFVGGFSPFLAANLLTYKQNRRKGVIGLWKRALDPRIEKVWYLPIFFVLPAFNLGALMLNILSGASTPVLVPLFKPWLLPADFLIMLFLGGSIQEFGWRGYALSRLQVRWNPIASSLALGLINVLWSIPLFFVPYHNQSLALFISPGVLSFLFTWLHNGTRGSILAVVLFRTMENLSNEVFLIRETSLGDVYYLVLAFVAATVLATVWALKAHFPEFWQGFGSFLQGSWQWLLVAISLWTLYLPVIAGVLFPMILLFGVTLFFYLSWWSWSKVFPDIWVFATSNIHIEGWNSFAGALGVLLLTGGLTIFALGLLQIVRARVNDEGLIDSGLYSLVRHPQHLGIAISTLGVLFLNKIGPRPGDIIAWTFLTFLFVILADREEAVLSKLLGEEYEAYCRKISFMIPFFPRIENFYVKAVFAHLPKGSWKRRILLTAVYAVLLLVLIAYLRTLPMIPMPPFLYG